MKKIILIFAVIALVLGISGTMVLAGDGIPSAKTVAASEEAVLVFEQGWFPILSTTIKTAEKSDLVISLSAESLIATTVQIGDTAPPSRMSRSSIQVAVWVDGIMARPGTITLNQEIHTTESSPLPLDTWLRLNEVNTSANTFNFIAVNVGAGVHTITAKTMWSGYADTGSSWGFGIFKRTMVVDQVRMAKPTQAAITLLSSLVADGQLTVDGFMWIGDQKSVEVSLEYWMGSPTAPPADPGIVGPVVMKEDGQFSFGPFPIDTSGITWYRAKLSYNGMVIYSSVRGVIPFLP